MENQIDFLALASQRYSVRSFLPQPIEKEALNRILQAGHLAPTACNLQPQRILVVDSPESVAKLRK